MKITLHTETVIDSCHQLKNYDGACARLHGHSWRVRVWVRGNLDQCNKLGILFDFTNVKKIKDKFDHRFINEIPPFDEVNPTAENLTANIYDELVKVNDQLQYCVRVYETAVGKECWCQGGDFDV